MIEIDRVKMEENGDFGESGTKASSVMITKYILASLLS